MHAGRPLRADGFAHHPYQFSRVAPGARDTRYFGISNIAKMNALLRWLAREHRLRTPAGQPLPIYFTKFGYPRQGAYYGFSYFTEARRADWVVKAFRVARRAGVRLMTYYRCGARPARRARKAGTRGCWTPTAPSTRSTAPSSPGTRARRASSSF